jgi:hypothetical protein
MYINPFLNAITNLPHPEEARSAVSKDAIPELPPPFFRNLAADAGVVVTLR